MSDGRGMLSESGLVEFCNYFVRVCLDQVRFMGTLLDPGGLMERMQLFVQVEGAKGTLDKRVLPVLTHALTVGGVQKAEAAGLMGVQERQARRLLEPLVRRGLLSDGGSKFAPWRLSFPISESDTLFPRLFAPAGVADATPAVPHVEEWGSALDGDDAGSLHPRDDGPSP
jgi:hypothetical protein